MRRIRERRAASQPDFDGRLAAYLVAAGAVGTAMATEAEAVIVSDQTVQPIGINGAVPIDFNSDGQIDFELDHDRVDLNVVLVDYLQIDKNDTNGDSHNNGKYAMYLTVAQPDQQGPNVIKPGENLNPVKTLRMRYDAWRKAQPASFK